MLPLVRSITRYLGRKSGNFLLTCKNITRGINDPLVIYNILKDNSIYYAIRTNNKYLFIYYAQKSVVWDLLVFNVIRKILRRNKLELLKVLWYSPKIPFDRSRLPRILSCLEKLQYVDLEIFKFLASIHSGDFEIFCSEYLNMIYRTNLDILKYSHKYHDFQKYYLLRSPYNFAITSYLSINLVDQAKFLYYTYQPRRDSKEIKRRLHNSKVNCDLESLNWLYDTGQISKITRILGRIMFYYSIFCPILLLLFIIVVFLVILFI